MQTIKRKHEAENPSSNSSRLKVSPCISDNNEVNKKVENIKIALQPKLEKGKNLENINPESSSKLNKFSRKLEEKSGVPKLKISFRKDIFNDNAPCKEELKATRTKDEELKDTTKEELKVSNKTKEEEEEDLFYDIAPLRPTYGVKGGRGQSSGRLGDKRYFTTRILTSFNKLARNPLLNRPCPPSSGSSRSC